MAGLFPEAAVFRMILVLGIAPAWYVWVLKVTFHVWGSQVAFAECDCPILIARMVGGALRDVWAAAGALLPDGH